MRLPAALLTGLALLVGSPATAAPPCVTAPEAESLVLVMAPDLLRSAGLMCQASLPPTALLRRQDGPLLQRYQVAADAAWPAAQGAMRKLAGPDNAALLDSMLARPLILGVVVPTITGGIKTSDCAPLDRMVTLLAPLPPRNTAGVLVAAFQLAPKSNRPGAAQPPLAMCPAARR